MVNDNNKPLFTAHTVPPVSPDIAGMPGSNAGATESKPQTAPAATPEEGYDRAIDANIRAYRDWIERHPLETEEEKAARKKRERSKRVIAAVADGLSALGNLVFTTKGAPSMFDGENTQTSAVQRQKEKLKAEREADEQKYYAYSMNIGRLQAARAEAIREAARQKAQDERMAAQEARKAQEYEFEKTLRGFKTQEAKGKGDKAAADAITAQITADNAQAYQKSRIDRNNRQPAGRPAGAGKAGGNSGGRSGGKTYPWWDAEGVRHEAPNQETAIANARIAGTLRDVVTGYSTNSMGMDTRKTHRFMPMPPEPEGEGEGEGEEFGEVAYTRTIRGVPHPETGEFQPVDTSYERVMTDEEKAYAKDAFAEKDRKTRERKYSHLAGLGYDKE